MLLQLLKNSFSSSFFSKEDSIELFWQMNAVVGYLVISMTMPYILDYEVNTAWVIPASLAFLWLIFSIDKGSRGKNLNTLLHLKKISPGQPVLIAAAFIAALLLSCAATFWSEKILDFFEVEYPKEQPLAETLKNSSLLGKILIGILVSVFAPLGEEIAFRRLLFGMLLPRGTCFSLVFTSLIFAFLHFYLKGFLALFVFAIILQLLYLRTKNLWTSVQVHIIFNSLTLINVLLMENP